MAPKTSPRLFPSFPLASHPFSFICVYRRSSPTHTAVNLNPNEAFVCRLLLGNFQRSEPVNSSPVFMAQEKQGDNERGRDKVNVKTRSRASESKSEGIRGIPQVKEIVVSHCVETAPLSDADSALTPVTTPNETAPTILSSCTFCSLPPSACTCVCVLHSFPFLCYRKSLYVRIYVERGNGDQNVQQR